MPVRLNSSTQSLFNVHRVWGRGESGKSNLPTNLKTCDCNLHRSVDRRVIRHLHHRLERPGGPHLEIENVFPVELQRPSLLVLGRVGRTTVHLMATKDILRYRRRLSSSETKSPGMKTSAGLVVQTRQVATGHKNTVTVT
jgi:hypothetical protein